MNEVDKTEWVDRVGSAALNVFYNGGDLESTLLVAFDSAAALGFEDGQEHQLERLRMVLTERLQGVGPASIYSWQQDRFRTLSSVAEAFGLEIG